MRDNDQVYNECWYFVFVLLCHLVTITVNRQNMIYNVLYLVETGTADQTNVITFHSSLQWERNTRIFLNAVK
jgi:hypothetical protein